MYRTGGAALSSAPATELFVSLGTNVDRETNLHSAIRALRARFGAIAISPVYESPAQGFDGDPFFNLVVALHSDESATAVMAALKQIEREHGRDAGGEKFAPRTLDLDLLTYGDGPVDVQGVHLPREDIVRYAFVLRPLAELAPEALHPALRVPYRTLWQRFAGADDLVPVAITFD